MLFIMQIALAQVEIVRFYGKVVSSLQFRILCGMVALPFLAISVVVLSIACLPLLLVTLFVVGVCALVYGLYHRGQDCSVAIVDHPVGEPVPSVEWLLADFELTVDNILADGAWQMQKDLVIAQYESFNPFDGMTSLGIPESRFWTNCQPVETILFQEHDLIECSVDIAVLPKKELFALAKQHGLKVSGKGRTLDVIRTELFKIMYGK